MNYETPVSFSDRFFIHKESQSFHVDVQCSHLVGHIVDGSDGLDCCGAFEDGNVFSEEEVKGGCSVGINVHMRNTSQVFFRVKTWARNPGCPIRVKLGSDDCLLMLILAPHCH